MPINQTVFKKSQEFAQRVLSEPRNFTISLIDVSNLNSVITNTYRDNNLRNGKNFQVRTNHIF